MKRYFYIPLLSLLFACGNSDNTETINYSNITFSIDTVMVDAGDDIINLKNGLWISGVDPTATYLYNWDQDNTVMEKINLDQLVLEEKLRFEKEGPNGVGAYVSWMYLTEEDQIIFSNFQDIGMFDFNRVKLRSYKLKGEKFQGDSLLEYESFNHRSVFTNGGKEIYGILGNWTGSSFTLAKLDFPAKKLKKYPLPDYDKLADYSVILKSADMMMIAAADQSIDKVENRLIFSNSIFNSLMVYDLDSDSLYKVEYPITLTKSSKIGKYQNEVESREEFRKIRSEMNREVNFKSPLWDRKNKLFYRFSYETHPLEDGTNSAKSKVYLTILDKDFKVLNETLVTELTSPPSMHFVKDGKIWMYENIDDELSFVRLSIQ